MNIFFLTSLLLPVTSLFSYADHDEYFHEEICELMHSRPFWIAEADTCGPFGAANVRFVDPKYRPFFSLLTVSGSPENGSVWYFPEREDTFETPVAGTVIVWKKREVMHKEESLEMQFKESIESSKVDTSYTSNFKDYSAQVYVWAHPKWDSTDTWDWHQSRVFFVARGFEFQISTSCHTGQKFAHPGSLWWRWLEEHWYWAEEKDTAWNRYPVVTPDSLWGWSDEQE